MSSDERKKMKNKTEQNRTKNNDLFKNKMSIISVLSSYFGTIEPKHQNHHKLYWGIKKQLLIKVKIKQGG